MDPLRNLMMGSQQQQQHYQPFFCHQDPPTRSGYASRNAAQRNCHQINNNNNVVTVEEAMDCREANSRFFSLINHDTRLHVIISKTSTLISCKMDGHEIVVDHLKQCQQTHETWAVGDRPFQKISSLPWNCHVRGAELMLSTSNGSSSIMYELNHYNELNCFVKLKSIHLQNQVVYFNLNNAKEKRPIDGHKLVVRCNGSPNRIQVQNTKLLCQCNKKASILPRSLIGDIPFELMQYDSSETAHNDSMPCNNNNNINADDLIVCDAIFSLNSTSALDYLLVVLRYQNRNLVFETRSNQPATATTNNSPSSTSTNNNNSSNNSAKVSSSTSSKPDDVNDYDQQGPILTESLVTSAGTIDCGAEDRQLNSFVNSPSTTTCQMSHNNFAPAIQKADPISAPSAHSSLPTTTSALSQPSSVLRVRVRVTNFGVSIMPLMMTNYSYTLRFSS